MLSFDKTEIKNSLTVEQVFELLQEWGGDPEYSSTGIVSATICHNMPGEGSRKLYYYENSRLFTCYTGCNGTFDIFDLTMKVANIQQHKQLDLNDAVRYVAIKFGILGTYIDQEEEDKSADWDIFNRYDRVQSIELKDYHISLQDYDTEILDRMNYDVIIKPWEDEGISKESMARAHIGYFPGADQITIPHYDVNGRFVGLRGRTMCKEEAEKYGKYRPILVNKVQYSHPLGMNLYNLNKSKENIKIMGKAIVFESEKSCLRYDTCFGPENDISVACCGSNLSAYQIHMLIDAGAKEIIVAFDRQFQEIGDKEFKHLTTNLIKINNRYKQYVNISFIFDKNKITAYKSSPIDESADKFLELFKHRVIL